MPLVLLGILILPLFYYIYLLASGGYRIYTSDAGLRVKKARNTLFQWDDLQVTLQPIKITTNYVSQTQVLKITFSDSSKKKSVVMRYDHAKSLLKELVERNILNEEVLADFV